MSKTLLSIVVLLLLTGGGLSGGSNQSRQPFDYAYVVTTFSCAQTGKEVGVSRRCSAPALWKPGTAGQPPTSARRSPARTEERGVSVGRCTATRLRAPRKLHSAS